MSYGQQLADLYNRQEHWVHSTPASYTNAAHNIFAITGGLVLITQILEFCDTAMTGATQSEILIGATALDAGGVAINAGGINAFVASPMDSLGVIVKVPSAVAGPSPSLLGFAATMGLVSGPGVNIIVTFSVVAMNAADRYSLHVKYRKIHPNALIS